MPIVWNSPFMVTASLLPQISSVIEQQVNAAALKATATFSLNTRLVVTDNALYIHVYTIFVVITAPEKKIPIPLVAGA